MVLEMLFLLGGVFLAARETCLKLGVSLLFASMLWLAGTAAGSAILVPIANRPLTPLVQNLCVGAILFPFVLSATVLASARVRPLRRVLATAAVCWIVIAGIAFLGGMIVMLSIHGLVLGPGPEGMCHAKQQGLVAAMKEWAASHDGELPDKGHWRSAAADMSGQIPWIEQQQPCRPRMEWLLQRPVSLGSLQHPEQLALVRCGYSSRTRFMVTYADGHCASAEKPGTRRRRFWGF